MNGNYTMKLNNNFGNSLLTDNDLLGDNILNYTEFGLGNSKNNIINLNNNLILSANTSEINFKDIKDEEEKK